MQSTLSSLKDIPSLKADIKKIQLSQVEAQTLALNLLQENADLKISLDAAFNLIAAISSIIASQDLPNKITFSYVLRNWRALANMIAAIVKTIKDNRK